MGYFIPLRRRVLKLLATGVAVAEMAIAGDLDLGGDDVFLDVIPSGEGVFIAQRMTVVGAVVELRLHNFVNALRLFPPTAGLTGLFAQLSHTLAGAPGGFELGPFLIGRIELPSVSWLIVSLSSLICLAWSSIKGNKGHSPYMRYGQGGFKSASNDFDF